MEARPQDPRFAEPDTTGSLGIPRRPFFASRDRDEFVPRPPGAVGAIGAPADAVPPAPNVAALPPDEQPEIQQHALAPRLRRQTVEFNTKEKPGTIIIDTQHTYLYLVLGRGQAMRYGIGVGRSGFTWSGREKISRMAEWPDWYPPEDMIERQPELPRVMAGGPGNPLGARALYLGNTLYRIHGTNQPSTIGKFVSSGCIRMLNEDAIDLYGRVKVGTRVVVLPGRPSHSASRK
jgi:lipoprotein-anchoring transpeptidase ErfK/SrfK